MKKEEFLKILLARLIERGITEETAAKETEHVRTYLTESGMEELDISVDEMADGIIAMLNDSSDGGEEKNEVIIPITPASASESESVSDELEAAIAAMDAESDPQPESTTTEESPDEMLSPSADIPIYLEPEAEEHEAEKYAEPVGTFEEVIPKADEAAQAQLEPIEETADPLTADAEPKLPPQTPPEPITDPEPIKDPARIGAESDEDEAEIEEFIPYDKRRRMKNKDSVKKSGNEWLYVALLVITIPIAVALILVAFVLYLGFWVALALAMIACIAILIVFVTAGAIVSLVGIVYGVVQLITGEVPVGLFEVGLGVIVGAAVMFVGILVYNFAVRFIPFGMKLLAKLFRAGFRAIRSGYQSLKGAVDSI